MRKKAAIILSGCGHMDGAEVRESVITLLELDRQEINFECFAPNINQRVVVDHLTGKDTNEIRNVLLESARIARGHVSNIEQLRESDYNMLLLPGGIGVVKNLSDISLNGDYVLQSVKKIVVDFWHANKPIGAICIAPALIALCLAGENARPQLTLGHNENADKIERYGGIHIECDTVSYVYDDKNNLFSCPAYMKEDRLIKVSQGIAAMIAAMSS